MLVVIMLNPSTADAETDDPTVLTLIHFAKLWGYGGLIIVNLFAYRTSDPRKLAGVEHHNHQINSDYIGKAIGRATKDRVLVAWGNCSSVDPALVAQRISKIVYDATILEAQLMCLGTTQSGAPKHPLARGKHRIPRDAQMIPWDMKWGI